MTIALPIIMLKQLYFNWILNCEIFWERILLMMAEQQLNNHFASPTIIKYTCVYANNVDVQSCGHNYNCAWAWSCLSTIRFRARMCLGTVMYGHNRMRALSCGHSRVDTIMCNCKRCPVYYAFRIYKSQVFFQMNKRYKSDKRTVRRHKSGNTYDIQILRIHKVCFCFHQ